MTRLEKCELLKSKGYTYDPETGKIYGVYGKEITNKNKNGYIIINPHIIKGVLLCHHFAWYWVYGNVDFTELDHINIDPSDNRISNLRISNRTQQQHNRNPKGYSYHKKSKKYHSTICVNRKKITLGYFNTEEEARNAYLKAKEKYHII